MPANYQIFIREENMPNLFLIEPDKLTNVARFVKLIMSKFKFKRETITQLPRKAKSQEQVGKSSP